MSWLAWLSIGVLVGAVLGFVASIVLVRKLIAAEIVEVAALTERIESLDVEAHQ